MRRLRNRVERRERPLRWIKFSVLLVFASICVGKAQTVFRVLAHLVDAPVVLHPEPLAGSVLAALATACLLVWILLDAAFDLLLPRGAVALLILLAALPWGARERSAEEEAWELRRVARGLAEAIGAEQEGNRVDAAQAVRALPPLYRGRSLQTRPFAIEVLPPDVSLPAKEVVRPATFYLAFSRDGGWLSVGTWADGRPRLLRGPGGIEVVRIRGREVDHGI